MTRDEAIKLVRETPWTPYAAATMDAVEAQKFVTAAEAQKFVTAAVALGMLKLEEPKSALDKFTDAILALSPSQRDVSTIKWAIDAAGLKIVEK